MADVQDLHGGPRSPGSPIQTRKNSSWNTRLVASKMNALLSSASPASRLPHDVLLEILQKYHSPGVPIRIPFRKYRSDSPITFSHVCQEWRNTAMNVTYAWASLHIEIAQDLSSWDAKRVCDQINICTKLSSHRPLDIHLSIYVRTTSGQRGVDYGSINPISVQIVFLELLQHSRRWRNFYLGGSYIALDEIMSYNHLRPTLPTPFLQAFHLHSESEPEMGQPVVPDEPYFDQASAPSLRTVSLYEDALSWAGREAFPWNQLEELNMGGIYLGLTLKEYTGILQGCKSLRRCQLSIAAEGRGEQLQHGVPIVLGAMETLVIIDHGLPVRYGDIYRAITCPKLKNLTINYVKGDECRGERFRWAGEALAAILTSSREIQKLHLSNAPVTELDLIRTLKDYSTISHLTVFNGKCNMLFGDQALFELTITPRRALLPMLERISIASRRCSGRYIEEFIKSRRKVSRTIAMLQRLDFDSLGSVIDPSLNSRLRWGCDRGFILNSL